MHNSIKELISDLQVPKSAHPLDIHPNYTYLLSTYKKTGTLFGDWAVTLKTNKQTNKKQTNKQKADTAGSANFLCKGPENILCKGPERKYCRLCRSYSYYCNSVVVAQKESRGNVWVIGCLCPNWTLYIKPGSGSFSVHSEPTLVYKNILQNYLWVSQITYIWDRTHDFLCHRFFFSPYKLNKIYHF